MADVLVEARGIIKDFGAIRACEDVSIQIRAGSIHGVLGENGAGKSTLMKTMIGLILPDAGQIYVEGVETAIRNPQQAALAGIGMVHQHLSVIDSLTVWENVTLGDRHGLDRASVRRRVRELSETYGLEVDPDVSVGELTPGMKQRVEIVKCLRRDPKILILDEPTSILSRAESVQLFEALSALVLRERRAVALVSHKIDEILRVADEVTVMRSGRVVARHATSDTDAPSLAQAIVGRPVAMQRRSGQTRGPELSSAARNERAPVLQIKSAGARGRHGERLLEDFSMEAYAGEIVGVVGVEGNGQATVGDLLSSLVRLNGGEVTVDGVAVATGRAGAMARAGIGVIPEDRHDTGCVLSMTVAENIFLTNPTGAARRGIMDPRRMRSAVAGLIADFGITCGGPDAPMSSLSGGNQQRVVLARELSANPRVLVAAQATRGLDVGAIEYMNQRLRQAADDGAAVVVISTDLDEVLELADRIVVIASGKIVGRLARDEYDSERIGMLMSGAASAVA